MAVHRIMLFWRIKASFIAMEGFIPAVHSITPFLAERPFEQIKDDFCYQQLGGNFISTGASYDCSEEGMTHHGPGDVQILHSLPGMQIIVPGSANEFDALFREAYANGFPTYYRLTVKSNPVDYPVHFGEMVLVSDRVPWKGTGLYLDSTATRNTFAGVPLWLHGPIYPDHLTLG
jgi:transketolase C-terminal domain/subunit